MISLILNVINLKPIKMKNSILFFAIAALLSCQAEQKQEPKMSVKTITIADGKNESIASFEIEGMTCEMGCGNSIKSAIAKLNGVTSTDIKFTEEKDKDFAIVSFNPSLVSENEIASAITTLFGGQYKIHQLSIEKHVQEKLSESNKNKPFTQIFSLPEASNYSLPNIFSIFFL